MSQLTGGRMFKRILCPIDGSDAAARALNVAAELARDQQAELLICSDVDPSHAAAMAFGDPGMSALCYDALESEAQALLREAAARVGDLVAVQTIRVSGQPSSGILECAASAGADLIVMGSHGRSGIERALLGSVAESVLRHASVPVMVVRRDGRERQPTKPSARERDSAARSLPAQSA
ncbi:MAG TPA: universal stress protein [Candidatus Baltobacteraceae bacterium]|nr:universal stress protein [Candidatus Baltobacteraceae bacterium]